MNALRQGWSKRSSKDLAGHPTFGSTVQPPLSSVCSGTGGSHGIYRGLGDTLEPHPEASLASFRTIRLHWVTSDVVPHYPAAHHPPTHGFTDASFTSPLTTPPPSRERSQANVDARVASLVPALHAPSNGSNFCDPAAEIQLPPDCFGNPITYGLPWATSSVCEAKMMKTIISNSQFRVEDMLDCFASFTEGYNSQGVISFALEGEFLPSPWEHLFPHKQVFGAIACLNCNVLNIEQQIMSIRAKFSGRYRNAVCRCVLVDPSDAVLQFIASEAASPSPTSSDFMFSSNDVFVPFFTSGGISIEVFTLQMIEIFARRTISLIIGRVRGLSMSLRDHEILGTPLDKPPLSCQDLDENSKTVQLRAAKQRGDYMMLLGASSLALVTLMQVPNSSSDKVWIIATMESIAAALEMETIRLLHPATRSAAAQVFADLSALSLSEEPPPVSDAAASLSERLEELREVILRTSREFLTGTTANASAMAASPVFGALSSGVGTTGSSPAAASLSGGGGFGGGFALAIGVSSSKQNALPRELMERIEAEVYVPLRSALVAASEVFGFIQRSLLDDGRPLLEHVEAARTAHAAVVRLITEQQKLILSVAWSQYTALLRKRGGGPPTSKDINTKLIGTLVAELMRRTCVLESQLPNGSTRILDVVNDISIFTAHIAVPIALRFQRRLPELCLHAALRRKAQYLVHQVVRCDVEEGNVADAVSLLLRALAWAGVPVTIDPGTGGLRVLRDLGRADDGSSAAPGSGGLRDARQTLRRSVTTTSSALFVDQRSGGSQQVQVNLLLLLGEALERARGVGSELRSHVAAFTLFHFADALDAAHHQRLVTTLRTTSHQLPRSIAPSPVPPPLIKSLRLDVLPRCLAPQWVQVAGASFIRTNDAMKTFYFRGKRRQDTLVWVAGTPGRVVLTLRNPFCFMLVLSTVRAACSFVPLAPPNSGGGRRTTALAPTAASMMVETYDLHDVQLAPCCSREVVLRAIPPGPGRLYVNGINVTVAELHYVQPMSIPLPKSISVEVMERLPELQISFPHPELRVYNGHHQEIVFTVHSLNPLVPAANVVVTVHHPQCVLEGCDGCIAPPRNAALRRRRRTEFEVEVLRGDINDDACAINTMGVTGGTPGAHRQVQGHAQRLLHAGQCMLPTLKVYPTDTCSEREYVPIMLRATYEAPAFALPPKPVEHAGIDANAPTYSPAPRRVLETLVRSFRCPSVEVTDVVLSADRRFIQIMVHNKCLDMTAVIENREKIPLERGSVDAIVHPGQSIVLRAVIAKLPAGTDTVGFHWRFVEQKKVHGPIRASLAPVLKNVKITEPLEELLMECVFRVAEESESVTWRSDIGIVLDGWSSSFSPAGSPRRPELEQHRRGCDVFRGDDLSLARAASIRLVPSREPSAQRSDVPGGPGSSPHQAGMLSSPQPVLGGEQEATDTPSQPLTYIPRFPAVKPTLMQLSLSAPWRSTLMLDVTVSFGAHNEGALLAGPVASTQSIGAAMTSTSTMHFEFVLFAAGNHTIEITVHDPERRMLRHTIRISAEHEGATTSMAAVVANSSFW